MPKSEATGERNIGTWVLESGGAVTTGMEVVENDGMQSQGEC